MGIIDCVGAQRRGGHRLIVVTPVHFTTLPYSNSIALNNCRSVIDLIRRLSLKTQRKRGDLTSQAPTFYERRYSCFYYCLSREFHGRWRITCGSPANLVDFILRILVDIG